jgi:SAM-dependent methyltransferase
MHRQFAAGTLKYVGNELDVFAHAVNWKRYWAARLRPYISGHVLEVGAGLGANTRHLWNSTVTSIHCLEPDADLAERLRAAVAGLPGVSVTVGTIESLTEQRFDTIAYIDVLEHIHGDKAELARAAALLRPCGRLVVLSPAHQRLFSPFDEAIGHYRRYARRSLLAIGPEGCRLEAMCYLDSAGLLTSAANRIALRQRLPTLAQIQFWDTYIIPVSRTLDPLLRYRLGKSILAVWAKSDA